MIFPKIDAPLRDSFRGELGLADYLPYDTLIEPDTLLTAYHGLTATWDATYADTAYLDEKARENHAKRIAAPAHRIARSAFGTSGWMLQTHALPMEAEPLSTVVSNTPHGVLTRSHREHVKDLRVRVRHLLSATYLPPVPQVNPWLKRLFLTGPTPIETSYQKVKADFDRGLETIEDGLSHVAALRRLGTHPADPRRNALLEAVFQVLYDDVQPIVIGAPFERAEISGLLAARDLYGGHTPRLGGKTVRVLSFFGYPRNVMPNALDAYASNASLGTRYAQRIIFEDQAAMRRHLDFRRRIALGKNINLLGKPRNDRTIAAEALSAEDAIVELDTGALSYGHLSTQIVIMHADPEYVESQVRAMRRTFEAAGFVLNDETDNAVEALFGHFIGEGYRNTVEGPANTVNFSRLVLSSTPWAGDVTRNCASCLNDVPAIIGLSRTGTDVALDPHEDDAQSLMVIGPPGGGKSFLFGMFLGNYIREPNDFVPGVDRNYTQFVATTFLGGEYRETERFWLFGGLEDEFLFDFLVDFLANLAAINGVNDNVRDLIKKTLELVALDSVEQRTLTNFVGTLGSHGKVAECAAKAIEQYTHAGAYRGVFDGQYEGERAFNPRQIHELGSLFRDDASTQLTGPVLLWALRSFVEQMRGRRSIALFEEAWGPLGMVAALLGELVRTLRFRHSGIALFTHLLADIKESLVGRILTAACRKKILLPNENALGDELEFYEKGLGLTRPQIEAVCNAEPKRELIVVSPGGFGVMRLTPSPAECVVYGSTSADKIAHARKLVQEFPDWRVRLLLEAGCKREADKIRSLERQHIVNPYTLKEAIA